MQWKLVEVAAQVVQVRLQASGLGYFSLSTLEKALDAIAYGR